MEFSELIACLTCPPLVLAVLKGGDDAKCGGGGVAILKTSTSLRGLLMIGASLCFLVVVYKGYFEGLLVLLSTLEVLFL
jgi:hypothetical protein